jgi:minor histocompatibility antigen H13
MPVTFQMLFYTVCILYIACHQSIELVNTEEKPEGGEDGEGEDEEENEFLSLKDAAMFPVLGSCALFSLYLAYKFVGPEWVNFLLGLYLTLGGGFAVGQTFVPLLKQIAPEWSEQTPFYKWEVKSSWILQKLVDEREMGKSIDFTPANVVAYVSGFVVSIGFFVTKHFIPHNIIGISFSLQAIAMVSLDKFLHGFVLLAGLFVYDIFWVFGTEVMVTVATKLEVPAKIIFPVSFDPWKPSILGLGDIVIPGFFIAMVLRYDAWRHMGQEVTKFTPEKFHKSFPKPHFTVVMVLCGS